MRFYLSQNTSDRTFAFDLQSDAGDSLLAASGFPTVDACTDAVRGVIAALTRPGGLVQEDGRILARAADGRVLAQSRPLAANAARTLLQQISDEAGSQEEYEVLIARTTETAGRRVPAFLQFGAADLAALYRFERASRSGQPGAERFQNEDDRQYYFHINDAAGAALLYSRGFNSATQRDKRLAAVLESAGMEQRYELREEEGRLFFILKARNGTEIARSRTFASSEERAASLGALIAQAPAALAAFEKPARPSRSSPADAYVLDRPSASGQPGFESFRNADTRAHYFHFNDDAGQALLYSQGYRNGKSRDNGIVSIIKNGGNREAYQLKHEAGRYYFVVLAGNRQQIARSRWFASEAEAERYISFFMAAMPGFAAAYGVDLVTSAPRIVTETERLTLAAAIRPAAPPSTESPRPTPPPRQPDAPARPHAAASQAPMEEASRGGVRLWLPWIIPLIALLILLFFLRGCPWFAGEVPQGMADAPEAAQEPPAVAPELPAPPPVNPPAAEVAPPEPPPAKPAAPALLGPDAAGLQLDAESLGGRLADFLSGPDRSLPRTYILDEIRFAYNATEFNEAGRTQAAGLAKVLVAYPGIRLAIEGHADRAETDRLTLSTNRARGLFQFLVDNGVPADRINYQGMGSNDPISKGDDAVSRQRNRRLTVHVQ